MTYASGVLLATSHAHWWSSYRCVVLERVRGRVLVHDLGLGFGSRVWVPYPLLGASGDGVIETDTASARFRHVGGISGGADLIGGAIGSAVGAVIVDRMMEHKARRVAHRLDELAGMEDERRIAVASRRYDSLSVRRIESKDHDARWLLSGVSPGARYFVCAASVDADEAGARVASLAGV